MYFSRHAALILLAGLTLTGCGSTSNDSASGQVEAVAAFYPLAYVVERVGGDLVNVTNLTSPGVEPHDLEPSPRDTATVATADLVILEAGFQPAIDETVKQNATGTIVDAAEVADLLPFDDHGHEDEEHSDEESHEGHDHGDVDPHFWLDPARMGLLTDVVAAELAELDADNAATYSANAEALLAELESLDAEYAEGLAQCDRDTVVVSHDAFGYLAKYDLEFEAIAGLSPDAEPTPGDLAKLKSLIESEGVTTVFAETLASPDLAQTLADEAGVTIAVLDPIEGLSDETSGEDYVSLMRANLTALREANGC